MRQVDNIFQGTEIRCIQNYSIRVMDPADGALGDGGDPVLNQDGGVTLVGICPGQLAR